MKKAFVLDQHIRFQYTELHCKHVKFEKLNELWPQKYDASCQVFQEIENKISSLENVSIEYDFLDDNAKKMGPNLHEMTSSRKQRSISLYKELSRFRKMCGNEYDDIIEWLEHEVDPKFHKLEVRI